MRRARAAAVRRAVRACSGSGSCCSGAVCAVRQRAACAGVRASAKHRGLGEGGGGGDLPTMGGGGLTMCVCVWCVCVCGGWLQIEQVEEVAGRGHEVWQKPQVAESMARVSPPSPTQCGGRQL